MSEPSPPNEERPRATSGLDSEDSAVVGVTAAGDPAAAAEEDPAVYLTPGEQDPSPKPVVDVKPPYDPARHFGDMQTRVLRGIFAIFCVTLVTVFAGLALRIFSDEIALELLRVVLPSVLAAGATVVGTLFVHRDRQE